MSQKLVAPEAGRGHLLPDQFPRGGDGTADLIGRAVGRSRDLVEGESFDGKKNESFKRR